MLSPATRQQLDTVLASLEKEDSTQLAVLTIHSLEGENLEEFSLQVAEQWRLGQKGLDNGALLIIAKNDRKLRIEVGYGLEGVLTDLTSGRIIRDIITPQFRNGNFDQGVIDGVAAMIAAVRGEFSEQDVASSGKPSEGDISGFVLFLLFALFNIGQLLGRNKMMAATVGAVAAPLIGSCIPGFAVAAHTRPHSRRLYCRLSRQCDDRQRQRFIRQTLRPLRRILFRRRGFRWRRRVRRRGRRFWRGRFFWRLVKWKRQRRWLRNFLRRRNSSG